jgi:2-amino-4-hydroxy-6-hydroxymethyldihydropteridine diphosphokinase
VAKQVRVYIGLGSNVGDSRRTLANAVTALGALPGARLRDVSRLYRTRPIGVADQPDFLNAVVALDVPAGPDPATGALALLSALKQLEQALGRQPRRRWGPREIDLDLLVFGRHQIDVRRPDGRGLVVPHAQMGERLFVLAPLADLAAGLRAPGWTETVGTVLKRQSRLPSAEGAVKALGDWRREAGDWG